MAVGLDQVIAGRTDLSDAEAEHLRRLVADWTLLADLGFSDLVLWVPTWNQAGFVCAAQVRPSTTSTVAPGDLVGRFIPWGRLPQVVRAWSTRVPDLHRREDDPLYPTADEAIPVPGVDRAAGVIIRKPALSPDRVRGAFEHAYLRAANDLAGMVASGDFPAEHGLSSTGEPPRVGDGLLRLTADGIVEYASPNAASALRRAGVTTTVEGNRLAVVTANLSRRPGPVDEGLGLILAGAQPGGAELETPTAHLTVRSVPLRRGGVWSGALVLVRDVTELRRQERALLTKDATIREIHHRVKNNLQTVSALLRLQARRIPGSEAQAALAEAQRRVAAIAVVHEVLAHEPGEDVEFDDVSRTLLTMVGQTASAQGNAHLTQRGRFGKLPAQMATSLSMALTELLANAVEHGGGDAVLDVYRTHGGRVHIEIRDKGPGLPADFDLAASPHLGLHIVRTLVIDELGGVLSITSSDPGVTATIELTPSE